MLLQADRVTKRFKGRFLGKSSPVHFFWAPSTSPSRGSRAARSRAHGHRVVDDARSDVTRGDQRRVLAGKRRRARAGFYAYVRPEPPGFGATAIRPKAAYYSRELADFILPYDAVRSASSPDEAVLDFYQSVYDAGRISRGGIARTRPTAGRNGRDR